MVFKVPSKPYYFVKINITISNVSPFYVVPPAVYAEHDDIWCGMSLGSVGMSCPSVGLCLL